jgi:hypothetical protein
VGYSIGVKRRFRCAYCQHHHNYGGSMHLRNVGILKRHYTALYPTRLSFKRTIALILLSRSRLCHYSVGGAWWHFGFYESF